MLVDPVITVSPFTQNIIKVMCQVNGVENTIKQLETGVYLIPHFSFNYMIGNRIEEYPDFRDYNKKLNKTHGKMLDSYGVVDSPEQFMELFGEYLKCSPNKFTISFTEIRRDKQPSDGGWRYHKWGSYYGTQNPEHEYLYDDLHIEKVYVFHVYEILS